jgi:hypothetical protein
MAGRTLPVTKQRAIMADWLDCGNYREVARRHNCTEGAIRRQRNEAVWWPELEAQMLDELKDSSKVVLGARFRHILDLIGERLTVGDPHVMKDGTVIYTPVRTRDLALTAGLLMDKLRLLEGKPQSLSATLNLNDLANQFRDIARGQGNLVAIQQGGGASEEGDPGAGAKS